MSALQNKIDFVALVSVNLANANGDPLNGNRPRTDYNSYGEMSDVHQAQNPQPDAGPRERYIRSVSRSRNRWIHKPE